MTSWDLGGDSNSFSFDNVGDAVRGLVLDLQERQQTEMDTNEPAYWDPEKTNPKMMMVVTLQTDLRDPANPADDGIRTVALAGSKKPESQSRMAAVCGAVKAATGSTSLQYKGDLCIQYIGDGVPTRKGFNAPKLYQAWYTAPAMELEKPQAQNGQTQQQAGPPVGSQQQTPPQQTPPQQPQGMPPAAAQHYGQAQAQQGSPIGQGAAQQADLNQRVAQEYAYTPPQQQNLPPQSGPPAGTTDPWQTFEQLQSQPGWVPETAPGARPTEQAPAQQPPVQQQANRSGWTPQGTSPAAQGDPKHGPLTLDRVASVKALGLDAANIFGPDWESRLVL